AKAGGALPRRPRRAGGGHGPPFHPRQSDSPDTRTDRGWGADSGVAVGSLVWRSVRKTRLVRSLGVMLRRWGGPAVVASAGEVAAPGARTFGAVFAPRSS